MTQMKLQRFDTQFLRDFRSPIVVNTKAIEADTPPPPPPPVFRESDVEQAREAGKKIGYAEGFEAGINQAKTEQTNTARDLTGAMERIEKHVAKLSAQYQRLVNEQSEELSELVLMIARKVAGDAIAANGIETVKELMARCLPVVFGKPKIAIELSPKMLPYAESALRNQLQQDGFIGDIEFKSNQAMDYTDVKIDWGTGAAARNSASLWQEIEGLLATVALTPTVPAVRLEEKKQPDSIAIVETGADNG